MDTNKKGRVRMNIMQVNYYLNVYLNIVVVYSKVFAPFFPLL